MTKFDYEKVVQINYLLNSRCNFMLNLLKGIREYFKQHGFWHSLDKMKEIKEGNNV